MCLACADVSVLLCDEFDHAFDASDGLPFQAFPFIGLIDALLRSNFVTFQFEFFWLLLRYAPDPIRLCCLVSPTGLIVVQNDGIYMEDVRIQISSLPGLRPY